LFFLLTATVVLVAWAVWLGTRDASASPPSLVLISVDTLRADRLGVYGYFRETSPNIDRFAADALVFDNAIAPMSTTLPSHVSIMTGTHPVRHGVLSNLALFKRPLVTDESLRTAAQMLSAAGYDTAAFISAAPLSQATGIDAGFAHFHSPPPYVPGRPGETRRAESTIDAARDWLGGAEPPYFLFVHLFDPHAPYEPPPPFDRQFARHRRLRSYLERLRYPVDLMGQAIPISNRYDGEIRYADREIGRLLAELERQGRFQDSVIVLTADHGEGLLQHRIPQHGVLYHEQIRVPLIFRFPQGPKGRLSSMASLIDILPTVAGHAGLPLDREQLDGVNLLAEPRAAALSQRTVRKGFLELNFTLTDREWKYWYFSETADQLYDLARDPHETRNVIALYPERAARMRAEILRLIDLDRERSHLQVTDEIPPEAREQLRALGYVE
jgi:arylsulfatase A-like enzyme